MIAQTIELPTISVISSMEKTVVRIMATVADSIIMADCLPQFNDRKESMGTTSSMAFSVK